MPGTDHPAQKARINHQLPTVYLLNLNTTDSKIDCILGTRSSSKLGTVTIRRAGDSPDLHVSCPPTGPLALRVHQQVTSSPLPVNCDCFKIALHYQRKDARLFESGN